MYHLIWRKIDVSKLGYAPAIQPILVYYDLVPMSQKNLHMRELQSLRILSCLSAWMCSWCTFFSGEAISFHFLASVLVSSWCTGPCCCNWTPHSSRIDSLFCWQKIKKALAGLRGRDSMFGSSSAFSFFPPPSADRFSDLFTSPLPFLRGDFPFEAVSETAV